MNTFTGSELCVKTATEMVALLSSGEITPLEALEAALTRIEAVEPQINAMPTICPERAREAIAALDRGDEATWLAGLPLAIKDLTTVSGVRTTFGTKAFAEFVPEASDPLVERLERRGGVVIGKSNTPEMGTGGNTFNDVFGMTRNPWNTALNAGGSSGGAAAALAAGEVWLAHGSDFAGSLRTPAAYCGIVGLRPSPGRCGGGGAEHAFGMEGVQGPMARTAEDCALFLDAMCGFDPRQPISLHEPATSFTAALKTAPAPGRIAFAPDLGGLAPVEGEVRTLMADAMKRLEGAGATVEEACPDLPGLEEAFFNLRGFNWAAGPGKLPQEVQRHFKRTLAENIAFARTLSFDDIVDAYRTRSRLYNVVEPFLRDYEAIACPVVGLGALPVEVEYPTEVDGVPARDYLDWLRFSSLSTTLGLPAISVPIGFTASGAAMGMQFIGRPRGEAGLLAIAATLEKAIGVFGRPIDPRP